MQTAEHTAIPETDRTTGRFYEDIIVDLSTCIVLQELEHFAEKNCAQELMKKIAALSLKFVNCWVVLYQKTRPDGSTNDRCCLT